MSVYLDYNASNPIDGRVLNFMNKVFIDSVGNADSRTHNYGENARRIVEDARKQVASLLGVLPDEVFFTSGATESNNIAILGLRDYAKEAGKKHIVTTSIEHKSVLETVKALREAGFEIDTVSPNRTGRVNAQEVLSKVKKDTLLVSVMHVNNETGIIQPVQEIGEILHERGVLFHVDATQSCGKLVKEIRDLRYDMLSFSGHKLMGPQGIGALILRKKHYKLPPVKNIMYGGQQEHGIRPGTLPVALIAGCGKACEIAEVEHIKNNETVKAIKEVVIEEIEKSEMEYIINGDPKECIANSINICFPGVSSEALMLSTKQYCGVSNGSACTSKNYQPSYVLKEMGISEELIESSIRMSWGANTDIDMLRENLRSVLYIAKQIHG